MINTVGRHVPAHIEGYGTVVPFAGAGAPRGAAGQPTRLAAGRAAEGRGKLLPSIRAALAACELRDGGTISFHHHLRNGDAVVNLVLAEVARRGLRDITLAASSLFPVHAPLVDHIRAGVVGGLSTPYVAGPLGDAIARGELPRPVRMLTHGGRARAIAAGELPIDVAFVGAPTADCHGNINGVDGPAACGTLGYALVDVRHARRVVAITDHLVPYPAFPAQISEDLVDFVVEVDSIGNAAGIVSGTTRATGDPIGRAIARTAARVIEAAGLLREGFSFQTGAGGISLAVAVELRELMLARGVRGSFASGGITSCLVDMLERGLFRALLDVQCFDLAAVASFRRHAAHREMSATLYADPDVPGGPVVDRLDAVILGAAEIDTEFNVNVTTGSSGRVLGGSGGHADTAAGARLAIVTTRINAGGFAKVVDRVAVVTTPGESIDVLVTDAGLAVNPRRPELAERLIAAGLPVVPIEALRAAAAKVAGPPARPPDGRIVAVVEYRDGSVIDVVRSVSDAGQPAPAG